MNSNNIADFKFCIAKVKLIFERKFLTITANHDVFTIYIYINVYKILDIKLPARF
jgi:hypothetical protein